MSFQLLLVMAAIAAFAVLAALRVLRVRSHRDPPEGWQRVVIAAALLLVPPLALRTVVAPTSGPGSVDAVGAVALYVAAFAVLSLLAWIGALAAARFAPAERRQALLLALTGRDTSGIIPFDPPMTSALAADVERVETANAVFPRGAAFLAQASLPGLQVTWEALDAATSGLEGRIADQLRLRIGVAERAIETAGDARGRLTTLRREAAAVGQAWAV